MIYKLMDGTRVRVRHADDGTTEFETYRFTPEKETLSVVYLHGEEARKRIRDLVILDAIRFGKEFGADPSRIRRQPRLSYRAVVGLASALTVTALAVVLYPNPDAPPSPHLPDVSSAGTVTPGERATSDTDRGGMRETLTPLPSPRQS
jgi:hypothetical protein